MAETITRDDIIKMTERDATFVPAENPGLYERAVRTLINDPRDLPFISLCLQATFTVIPFAAVLFYLRDFPVWLGLVYLAFVYLVFTDRYILMLHNTSHRTLFKKHLRVFNLYIPWVLGPFCGETPETYFVHHVGMHHVEDNLPKDLSSTMRYQRDRFSHWLVYFFRFLFFIHIELAIYFVRKKRYNLLRRMVVGEGLSVGTYLALGHFVSWEASLFVFIIPTLFTRALMMAGNWGQHAFVDPDDPTNNYKSSITCIDSRYNRRAFNDGYHIGHHLKATMHWTEMPVEFAKNIDRYAKEGSFIFKNTDFFLVWLMLVTRSYKLLARHYVHLGEGPAPSEDELIALFKSRLSPSGKGQVALEAAE